MIPKVDALIEAEKEFFSRIHTEQNRFQVENLESYRSETVSQRRARLSKLVHLLYGGVVTAGAFKGLRIDADPFWGISDQASKILGIYEIEVLDEIFRTSLLNRRHFIDLGAADGYYGVGGVFSGRFDTADLYEISEEGHRSIRRNAAINGVSIDPNPAPLSARGGGY